MRHISRTHRVALDLLFDRINLDPKIQIKYVDTKKQLTIFSLCSISAFSSLPACPETMSKKNATRNRRGENCGKVKADAGGKLFNSAEFECISSSGDAQSTQAEFEVQGDLRLKIQITMMQRRVLKCGNQMQRRTTVRGDSLLQERNRTCISRQCKEICRRKFRHHRRRTQSGRVITASLVLTFHISRKSTRLCDRKLGRKPETKWKTSMWSLWCEECLCLSPWMPQFILEWITWRICILPTISHNEH